MASCNIDLTVTIDTSLLFRSNVTALYQPAMPEGYRLVFRDEGSWYHWQLGGAPGRNSASKDPAFVVKRAWEHLIAGGAARAAGIPQGLDLEGVAGIETMARVDVDRLDLSKDPPGYFIYRMPGTGLRDLVLGFTNGYGFILHDADEPEAENRSWSREQALTAAQEHYQARRDPPGMGTYQTAEDNWRMGLSQAVAKARGVDGVFFEQGRWDSQAEARAAAWRWYLRRLVLVDRLERSIGNGYLWPYALLCWTDNECEAVERWIVDGMTWTDDEREAAESGAVGVEMPAVLSPDRLRAAALREVAR